MNMKLGSILLPSFFIIFIEADFPPASEFEAPPTCIVCRNWKSDFTMLEPRQLARYCKLTFRQLLCLWPRQLAMSVKIGNPISLCCGPFPQLARYCKLTFRQLLSLRPRQLARYCKLTFRQLLCWARFPNLQYL
ncbi:pathogenicity island protein [Staphylococcus aureus]|nr:pathogenicity island protein [Staphylococcus aureus]